MDNTTHDAIGNEIKAGDHIIQVYVGRGSCTMYKAKIEHLSNTRIYYKRWYGEQQSYPSKWSNIEWTSRARVLKYDWNEDES